MSDRGWKTTPGPILFSSTWGGEDYDARKAPNGWLQTRFDDASWSPAEEVEGPGGVLRAQSEPPIRIEHEYAPVALREPKKGIYVYDLGQNFSGWPQIQVQGEAGKTLKLTPGELLNADGTVTQSNLAISSGAPSMFQYTLSGNGVESWHPLFSYWGFRYVQVEGAAPASQPEAGKPILSLKSEFLHGDVAPIGKFSSSNELLGRIHTLIGMAILSNTMSILTDCPTREKLGWLEQVHLNAGTLLWNYDFEALDEKMAADMRDVQRPDGMMPTTAPEYGGFGGDFGNSPEWGSAAILMPGYLYRFTGDRTILANSYAMMTSYRRYLKSRLQNGLIGYGLGDWYDIGPGNPGNSKLTGKGVTATAMYYQDLLAVADAAEVLGKPDDAKTARDEAETVKQGFNAALFHPDTNQYDRGSQTANAMPLALGMVPAGHEQQVLENLVADIRHHQNHVTAGDVGFHYVVQALTDYGRSDVLYDMMMRTDAPSYGYQLAQGATTLTEAWDANRSSSWNHFMLGHADVWLYRGLAGLRIDMAAKHPFTIQPTPVGNIAYASATYESVLGKVASSWKLGGDAFQLHVELPVNATATILVPSAHPERVTVGGQPVSHADGVSECQAAEGGMRCVVGSGAYDFAGPAPAKH